MKISQLSFLGLILILIGLILFLTDSLNPFIRPFTHIFLMGSSKGKDILFFILMGIMLLISPLFSHRNYLKRKIHGMKPFKEWSDNDFLKIAITIALFTYAVGILIEIWIRWYFNVSIFTTFVSLNPSPSTTSILHSHVFKGVISPFFSTLVSSNSNIYTGESLMKYIPSTANIIFLTIPAVFMMGMFSLGNRRDYHKLIIIFALTTTIIGMIDGGLLSTPSLVGLSGLLGMYALKVPFSFKNLINPALIISFFIILRVFLGIFASVPDYYEVTIIGEPENLELADYEVQSLQIVDNTTIITMKASNNELDLIKNLTNSLSGKTEGFFISWNFYSFFKY